MTTNAKNGARERPFTLLPSERLSDSVSLNKDSNDYCDTIVNHNCDQQFSFVCTERLNLSLVLSVFHQAMCGVSRVSASPTEEALSLSLTSWPCSLLESLSPSSRSVSDSSSRLEMSVFLEDSTLACVVLG